MKDEKNIEKRAYRGEAERKIITNRINRIEGQLHGIKKMIQEDKECNDILVQLSAVQNSVKSLSNLILENHLYTCVANDVEKGNLEIVDELINLFKKFNK